MAGVSGKKDSVSLLWVTNHAFQPREAGNSGLYRAREDYIVSRYSGTQVRGHRFHFSKLRPEKAFVKTSDRAGGPRLSDCGTGIPASGKDFISELSILTVVASTEGSDTCRAWTSK